MGLGGHHSSPPNRLPIPNHAFCTQVNISRASTDPLSSMSAEVSSFVCLLAFPLGLCPSITLTITCVLSLNSMQVHCRYPSDMEVTESCCGTDFKFLLPPFARYTPGLFLLLLLFTPPYLDILLLLLSWAIWLAWLAANWLLKFTLKALNARKQIGQPAIENFDAL